MEIIHMFQIVVATFTIFFNAMVTCTQVKEYPLLMPNVHPDEDELYLCTSIKVAPDKSFYIVGFEPNATMETAHHILLYGCMVPGSDQLYWNCGEMTQSQTNNRLVTASPCKKGLDVIYAWARNAKTLELPEDVGFQVGAGTQIQYIVLQVHYSHVDKFKDGSTDDSGIFLKYTEKPQSKLAGVLLLETAGVIPPMSETYMETACKIKEEKTIYPFAYRTHTHSLGKVVAGYKVSRDQEGEDHWTLLGKRNPLSPQTFYPVLNNEPITYGDTLAARCTMKSNRTTYTYVGATSADEMCLFYLMYYVKKGQPLDVKYCFTPGPPYYYWDNSKNNLNNIPKEEASSL